MTAGVSDENHCKKCGNIGSPHMIPEPEESRHNIKLVCANCGATLGYEGKPKTNLEELGRWAVYDTGQLPEDNTQDWRFNFGEYRGQRIREVMQTTRGLNRCKWIIGSKTDFSDKCPRLVDLIEEIAEEEGIQLG